ncbi:MAG: heme A synthase [Acidimicrobiales bacterium]|nr:heme A synthase [Acidimicrobiales bacterium]
MIRRLSKPLTPSAYRRITWGALALLVLIVLTGAGVRLTGSGLGCTDWPNCTDTQFVAPMELHPMVEFMNRLVTGLVSIAVAAAVLGSLRRVPRRRDLTWLSIGLVGGVVAQILVGRVVVVSDLNPWWVQMHMVVSLVLVADATLLTHRAGLPDDRPVRPAVTPALLRWGGLLVVMATTVVLTGTLVTGSGPHSGHNESDVTAIRRLPIAVHDAARIHGIAMIGFLAVTVWILVQIRRHHPGGTLQGATDLLLTLLVIQAGIGYAQYFTGVPPLLVALHILGACLVWFAALNVFLHMRSPLESGTVPGPSLAGEPDASPRTRGDLVPGRR